MVAWTRQLEADDAYDKRKVLLHVHELSPLGLRSALVRAGFTARVWVDEVDHRWSHGADSRELMRRLVGVSHVHYLVGREMYAAASPRRRRSSV